ncbi:unnamed protein product, partial [Bubo scandiacus]
NTREDNGKPPRRFALMFCKKLIKSVSPFLYDTNGFLDEQPSFKNIPNWGMASANSLYGEMWHQK